MRNGERAHRQDERAQAPEREHEAKQEQQVVDSVQDVQEPQLDEPQRSLVPARIKPDEARVAVELVSARRSAGWQEPKRGDRAQPQSLEPGVDRKLRAVRAYRILEQCVEQSLVPIEFSVV